MTKCIPSVCVLSSIGISPDYFLRLWSCANSCVEKNAIQPFRLWILSHYKIIDSLLVPQVMLSNTNVELAKLKNREGKVIEHCQGTMLSIPFAPEENIKNQMLSSQIPVIRRHLWFYYHVYNHCRISDSCYAFRSELFAQAVHSIARIIIISKAKWSNGPWKIIAWNIKGVFIKWSVFV